MKKKTLLLGWALLAAVTGLDAQSGAPIHTLTSPDGKLKVEVRGGEHLSYSISHEGRTLVADSEIGMVLEDGTVVGQNPRIASRKERKDQRESIEAPFYRVSRFDVAYVFHAEQGAFAFVKCVADDLFHIFD